MKVFEKAIEFAKKPHIPWFIVSRVKKVSPPVAKFMQYGRTNINTKEFWDAFYSSGAYQDTEHERHQYLIDQVVKLVEPKSTVLDVGCGTGLLVETLRTQRGCNCVGIDISEVSIDMLNKMGICGYMTELPNLPDELRKSKFDYITILETLEHLSRPEKTLKALLEHLKPGGLIISTVPNDCMSPQHIDEHLSTFTQDSLRDLVGINYNVKECLIIKSGVHEYLVCVAEPKTVS